MTNFFKKIYRSKNERGIALLFSLMFLALLMVLALSFASNAMIEQKIAYYGKSSVSSRMLADSAVNRIVTLMQFYDSGVYYSRNSGSPTISNSTTVFDSPSDLQTKEGDSFVFEWLESAYHNKVLWDFIKQRQFDSDGTAIEPIIGRVAYVIIPDGEISPLSLVKSGVDEASYAERRVGDEVNEVNVQSIDSIITPTIAGKINLTGTGSGVQPLSGWTEFPSMFSALGISAASTKNDFRKWFLLDAVDDREAYWLDTVLDGAIEQTDPANAEFELYQRFNLTGSTLDVSASGYSESGDASSLWKYIANDEAKMFKQILLDNNADGTRDLIPPLWQSSNDDTSYGSATRIPGLLWLANFTPDGTETTFSSTKNHRAQIAANLVDYCDEDSVPTSDVAASNWDSSAPSYTGNEKTPYLNEVYFNVTYYATIVNTGLLKRKFTVNFDFDCGGEVIDIYDCSYADTYVQVLSLVCDFSFTKDGTPVTYPDINVPVDGGTAGKYKVDTTWRTASAFNSSGYGYVPYGVFGITSIDVFDDWLWNMPTTVTLTGIKVKSAQVLLIYDGKNVDYANLKSDNSQNSSATMPPFSWTIISFDTSAHKTGIKFQANDPRQNLNEGDWWLSIGETSSFVAGKNTGVVEDISTASTDRDQESLGGDALFPAYDYSYNSGAGRRTISTAYIRNRPMISPWELGLIHRGYKWQTINLKAYDESKAVSTLSTTSGVPATDKAAAYNIGGGKYSLGDGNILDQIKMTNVFSTPKKINLKTHRDEVLTALLDKVKCGSDPDEFVGSATINGTDFTPSTAISAIKQAAIDFKTRGNLAAVSALQSVGTSDARQEEVVGKIANLTTASGKTQYFTVIVLAQSVKDVGGTSGGVPITKASLDGTKTLEKPDCEIGQFDYRESGGKSIYYDEIMSTTKIMVRLYRNETGQVKVLSYQYVE